MEWRIYCHIPLGLGTNDSLSKVIVSSCKLSRLSVKFGGATSSLEFERLSLLKSILIKYQKRNYTVFLK